MKKSILALLFFITITSYGQNQFALNQQKYWDYRNRLKKMFMVIGKNNGQSLTYNNRWQWPHNDTDCMAMEKRWLLTQEDNPIYQHGTYLTILATEYALLKHNKQDVTELLNELYFALFALERLDKKSDQYLLQNDTISSKFDGNLLRTDIDFQTDDDWELHDSISLTKSKSFKRTNSSNYGEIFDQTKDKCDSITYINSNILSVDEVAGLLIGFKYILKYVDNVEVQPDPTLDPHKILDWVKTITEKIADQWSSDKTWTEGGINYHGNWLIRNPAPSFSFTDDDLGNKLDPFHKIPIGGHAWLGLATPLSHIFTDIVGKTYTSELKSSNLPFIIEIEDIELVVNDPSTFIPFIKKYASDTIWHYFKHWPSLGTNITDLEFKDWHFRIKTEDQRKHNQTADSIDYINGTIQEANQTGVPKVIKNGLFSFCILLFLMDNPTTQIDYNAIHLYSSAYGFKITELMFKTLYPERANDLNHRPRFWYDSLLNDAPATHSPQWDFDPNNNFEKGFIDSKVWGLDDIFTNAAQPGEFRGGQLVGFKNGMDYMHLYNLYHLAFLKDSLPYAENSCDCWQYRNYIHDLSNVNTNKTITGMHPSYHAIGVEDRSYINQPATIQNGATVTSYTSIDVCSRTNAGNGFMHIYGGFVQGHPTDIMKAGTLTIKPNNELVIGNGNTRGFMEVNSNNCIFIKKGATCYINNLSEITVLGKLIIEGKLVIMPGAKLFCNGGKIELRPGAELIINSGGILDLDNEGKLISDSSYIHSEAGSLIHLAHASVAHFGPNGIYQYAKNAVITIDHLLSNFKIDCIFLLEHNSLFTFNTSPGLKHGFITLGPNILIQTIGENQKIELHGNGLDTYLRLEGNPIFRHISDITGNIEFESVVLGDGRIESIGYGGMQVYAPFEFKKNFANGAGKIMVFGQQSCVISQNVFEGMSLEANLSVLVNTLELERCTFANGAGLIIKNGTANIHHNEFSTSGGLTLQTMSMAVVHDCIFNNANVSITGNSAAGMMQRNINYYFEKCDFVSNVYTAFTTAHASISIKCCMFKENSKAIDAQESYINMSRHILTNNIYTGGDNLFMNNIEGITSNMGGIYINNGGNSFILSKKVSNQTGNTNYTHLYVYADYDFKHDTSAVDLINCVYKSDNNFWYPREVSWRNMEVKKVESVCYTGMGPHPTIFDLFPTDTMINEVNNTCILASSFRYQILNDTGLVKIGNSNGNVWSSSDWNPTIMPNPIGGIAVISFDNFGNETKVIWLQVIRVDGTIARDNIYITIGLGQTVATLQLNELNNGIYKFLFVNTNNTEEVVSRIVIKNE